MMLRGNGGQAIFFDDDDRNHLYLLLQEGIARFGHQIYAFCLMDNHLHLAVQVSEVPLSKIMQNVSFRYTRWINKRQSRIGHLFQGRYKAILVDAESYLLELVRYIHLNPVRANLVADPIEYRWSGHRAYLGEQALPWLASEWVLSHLAKRKATARKRYGAFVAAGLGEGHRAEFHGGTEDTRVLGDDRFTERVTGKARVNEMPSMSLRQFTRRYCKVCLVKQAELVGPSRARTLSEQRAMLAWLAVEHGLANLVQLGSYLHRDATTLSRAVQKIDTKRKTNRRVARRLRKIINAIMQPDR